MNTTPFILVNMLANFALLLLFLRFMVQLAQVDGSNPFAKTAYRFTGIVDVFTRIFPTTAAGRISTAAVVLMLLMYLMKTAANAAILGEQMGALKFFLVGSLSAVIHFLQLLRYTLIGAIVVSWIMMLSGSSHGLLVLIGELAEPIVAPFRRIIPPLGMFDLSSLVALFALYLAEKSVIIIGSGILQRL